MDRSITLTASTVWLDQQVASQLPSLYLPTLCNKAFIWSTYLECCQLSLPCTPCTQRHQCGWAGRLSGGAPYHFEPCGNEPGLAERECERGDHCREHRISCGGGCPGAVYKVSWTHNVPELLPWELCWRAVLGRCCAGPARKALNALSLDTIRFEHLNPTNLHKLFPWCKQAGASLSFLLHASLVYHLHLNANVAADIFCMRSIPEQLSNHTHLRNCGNSLITEISGA